MINSREILMRNWDREILMRKFSWDLVRNLMGFSWEISREILMRNWDTILMRILMRNPYEKFLMRFSWELLWEISHKALIWEISHDHSFHQKCLLPEQYNPLERSCYTWSFRFPYDKWRKTAAFLWSGICANAMSSMSTIW